MPLPWRPELDTGHPVIDAQHRELYRLAGEILSECERRGFPASAGRLLDAMERYATHHFETEEALMRATGYPARAAHRIEHDYFTNAVGKLRRRLAEPGGDRELCAFARDFLGDWLVGHIGGADRMLARHASELAAAGMA